MHVYRTSLAGIDRRILFFTMHPWLKLAILLIACCPAYAGDCSSASIWLSAVHSSDIVSILRADNIRTNIGGQSAKVLTFSLDTHPRRIILLVDTSASMCVSPQDHRWGVGLLISGFAADAVPFNAAVMLLTVGEKATQISKDFQTRSEVQQEVLSLKNQAPAGRTPLLDSIAKAASMFGVPQFGDAIYLVSDGGDNKSTITVSKLQPQLIERGIRIFAFSVRQPSYDEEQGPNPNLMKDLAEFTGGEFLSFPDYPSGKEQSEMPHLALRIAKQAQELYRVELEVPEPAPRNKHLKITLAKQPSRRDLVELAYPRLLRRCDLLP
jgi:hypothetical protein